MELAQRYKRSWLGIWWSMLNPLCTVTIYYFLFVQLIKNQNFSDGQYLSYLITGVVFMSFSIQSITLIADSFVVNTNLIKKIKVNPHLLAGGVLSSSFFNFLISCVPLILVVTYQEKLGFRILALVPLLALLILFLYSTGLCLAVLYTLFDDSRAIVRIIISFLPFFTPVFYTLDQIPTNYRSLVELSPFTSFLILFRWIFGFSEKFDLMLLSRFSVILIFSILSLILFQKSWPKVVRLL
jgi:ABC-type polysaccharide/polyol phosphate export permease